MIVLDTNVLSEVIKTDPSAEVSGWLALQPPTVIFTTAITQAELLYGIELMAKGRRRSVVEAAIVKILTELFANRILPFESDAAEAYSRIASSRRAMGRPMSEADARIAAIALSHGAELATRNARDFAHCGIKVLNPWGQ